MIWPCAPSEPELALAHNLLPCLINFARSFLKLSGTLPTESGSFLMTRNWRPMFLFQSRTEAVSVASEVSVVVSVAVSAMKCERHVASVPWCRHVHQAESWPPSTGGRSVFPRLRDRGSWIWLRRWERRMERTCRFSSGGSNFDKRLLRGSEEPVTLESDDTAGL